MSGETLRDKFAMAALQGLLASGVGHPNVSREAYEIADDMMQARGGDAALVRQGT